MAFQLYNSYSGSKENFRPADPKQVRIYNCGPTVYNYNHIGNFRSYIAVDQLRRYLKFRGYGVEHTSNITDVDDKIIENAIREKKSIQDFTEPFVRAFLEDLESLSIEDVEHRPRATDHIETMLGMISELEKRGHTYVKDGSVYFRLKSFENYGKLSKIDQEQLKTAAGGRFDADEYTKEDVRDFALWKAPAKKDEPAWPSDWGEGRPGWHLECSAMIRSIYGKSGVDIHAGGIDLLFPHHENEMAQSNGAYPNDNFVRYWMHNEHLLVDSKKMSKSLGNFFMLRDFLEKDRAKRLVADNRAPSWITDLIDSGKMKTAVRFVLLSTHYRNKLNFTFDSLKAASSTAEKWQNAVTSLITGLGINEEELNKHYESQLQKAAPGNGPGIPFETAEIEQSMKQFTDAMDDDLNISKAIAAVYSVLHLVNPFLDTMPDDKKTMLKDALHFFYATDHIFGILDFTGKTEEKNQGLNEEIQSLIEERVQAKKNKDFARADEIRDNLLARGISLKDTPQGTVWEKVK